MEEQHVHMRSLFFRAAAEDFREVVLGKSITAVLEKLFNNGSCYHVSRVYGTCVSKMERLVEKLEMENATSLTDEERSVR